ncbi:MAG: adenylate/guanylate cyclase [Bacteroidota bacterium]|nr:adenylate/guanylate cyclase [Bacteroidota bacterium]
MNLELNSKIENEVNKALDNAENIWNEVGDQFVLKKGVRMFSEGAKVPSQIPGHKILTEGKPEVGNFIALVLDIRNSTDHLLVAAKAKATQLERVLYETTAVNAAGAVIIEHYNGGLTEYLGDGFLALFKVEDEKNSKTIIYSAHDAAKYCLNEGLKIVNDIIYNRYQLPKLSMGIGLAYSKAIVTIVGINDNLHPKAIGECVFRASKLAGGHNEIHIDEHLKYLWPKSDDGQLRFIYTNRFQKIKGYLISRKN